MERMKLTIDILFAGESGDYTDRELSLELELDKVLFTVSSGFG
jgi:hypothetical protein